MIEIIVRDGRFLHDKSQEQNAELFRFQCSMPFNVGARFHLPPGTELVEVIGSEEQYGSEVAQQTLYVGDAFNV